MTKTSNTRPGPELLPCPFCGAAAKVCEDDSYGGCMVGCGGDCDLAPDQCCLPKGRLAEAITAWNTRANARPGDGGKLADAMLAKAAEYNSAKCLKPTLSPDDEKWNARMDGAAGALRNFVAALRSQPAPYSEMLEYEERILAAEMRAERLKRLIPQPAERGSYKGDTFYPVGGTEASHEWDGEKWVWLSSLTEEPSSQPTPSEDARIPDALWPYIKHDPDCVLMGHWMPASEHDCDCGLAEALNGIATPSGEPGDDLVERAAYNRLYQEFDKKCRVVNEQAAKIEALSQGPSRDELAGHIASILEEWDMKDPPNECTGHDYRDIASDIIARALIGGDDVERVMAALDREFSRRSFDAVLPPRLETIRKVIRDVLAATLPRRQVIEFAPAFKSVNTTVKGRSHQGTYWYAEGWIGGERFEFATQESRHDAEELCNRLNTVIAALGSTRSVEDMRERAAVVKWLRNKAYSFRTPNAGLAMDAAYRAWRDAADAIERGEHLPIEGEGI